MSSKKQTHKQPSSSASSKKSKAAPHPNPLEIQAKDLKVSGFCSPGVGTKKQVHLPVGQFTKRHHQDTNDIEKFTNLVHVAKQ